MMDLLKRSMLRKAGGEEGSALVVALIILVVLTIIGISATSTTQTEIQIAGNEEFHKIAFYYADSGVYATPKLISLCIDNDSEQSLTGTGMTYLGDDGTFYRELMGFDPWDEDRDVRFTMNGFNVDVDVRRAGVQNIAGGGVEFASGAEGIGVGSMGGVAVLYAMRSQGNGPASSLAGVEAVYRKVMGIPGGL
jgi:hypothetical protein